MPALKYRYSGGFVLKTHHPENMNSSVEVEDRGGQMKWFPWHGFICEAGAKIIAGGISKMSTYSVTSGDGGVLSEWRILDSDEKLKCCWVPYNAYGVRTFAIHAVIDSEGLPIIVK